MNLHLLQIAFAPHFPYLYHQCSFFSLSQIHTHTDTFMNARSQDMLLRSVRATKVQQTGYQPLTKTHRWSYASAFLYSITLITTIGKHIISFIPRARNNMIYFCFGFAFPNNILTSSKSHKFIPKGSYCHRNSSHVVSALRPSALISIKNIQVFFFHCLLQIFVSYFDRCR